MRDSTDPALNVLALHSGQTGHTVHHFEMGHWVMGLSFGISMIGSIVGLACAHQAGLAVTARYRLIWRAAAAIAIGGIGIWLMHFIAMMGFAVPGSIIRYDPARTGLSAALSIVAVYLGLSLAGAQVRWLRLLTGGLVMGLAVAGMHYTGMWAIRIQGTISESIGLLVASVAIAVAASTVALWFAVSMTSVPARVAAAAVMAVAVVGMHYTGMAAVHIDYDRAAGTPSGWDVFDFLFPIFLISFFMLAIPIAALMMAPDRRDRVMVPDTAPVSLTPQVH